MASDEYVTATGYVVVEAKPNATGGVGSVGSVGSIDRTTARPPYLQGAQIAIKLHLRIPKSAFNAAIADITIDIPEELVSVPDVTVEAV